MTDNKRRKPQYEVVSDAEQPLTEEVEYPVPQGEPVAVQTAELPSAPDNPYWTEQPWKMGLITLYRCSMCQTDRNEVDSIMEHILLHYPAADQEAVLTEMLALSNKEK